MALPESLERTVRDAVTRHLQAELGARGLLPGGDREAGDGPMLLGALLAQCYPGATLEFDGDGLPDRMSAAMAFGAAAGRVFGSDTGAVDLLCGTFNLGIGLVDGLCDGAPELGGRVLEVIAAQDVAAAARQPRPSGWLGCAMPPAIMADATVAFTTVVIEAFFAALHRVYPAEAALRTGVGAHLRTALDAERRSMVWRGEPRDALVECSRRTSVLPFEILEALASGRPPGPRSRATMLGEAVWVIDDLVDLCQDARAAALNGVLLAVLDDPVRLDESTCRAGLERLLDTGGIATAAATAAVHLADALAPAPPEACREFLGFIQEYVGP